MILAVDPGKSGGLAWMFTDSDGSVLTASKQMPDTDGDIVDLLREFTIAQKDPVAYIELVGGFVRGGENRQPGSAMFKFGDGYGFIRGVLMAFGWRVIFVRPQEWQKHFSLGTRSNCATNGEWKNKLKSEAQRRFPNQHVTLKTADALLILEYAKMKEGSV